VVDGWLGRWNLPPYRGRQLLAEFSSETSGHGGQQYVVRMPDRIGSEKTHRGRACPLLAEIYCAATDLGLRSGKVKLAVHADSECISRLARLQARHVSARGHRRGMTAAFPLLLVFSALRRSDPQSRVSASRVNVTNQAWQQWI
jgi:hypothetical protein